jgi:hypothetical protein
MLLHRQGIEGLIKALQARGIAVYLISGGFRCAVHNCYNIIVTCYESDNWCVFVYVDVESLIQQAARGQATLLHLQPAAAVASSQ